MHTTIAEKGLVVSPQQKHKLSCLRQFHKEPVLRKRKLMQLGILLTQFGSESVIRTRAKHVKCHDKNVSDYVPITYHPVNDLI